ncbi:MAG TPA: hypothetical protein VMU63_04470 [Acidimicrobiales bacterium]|nr:hypothetical protein [Acidimicrobiales bacterium]
MRTPLALLGAAALSALGGAILGEYSLSGILAVIACLLYGIVIGEALIVLERRPSPLGVAVAGIFPPIGWLWSLWISTGHHLHYASATQLASTVVAGVSGAAWAVTGRRALDRARPSA